MPPVRVGETRVQLPVNITLAPVVRSGLTGRDKGSLFTTSSSLRLAVLKSLAGHLWRGSGFALQSWGWGRWEGARSLDLGGGGTTAFRGGTPGPLALALLNGGTSSFSLSLSLAGSSGEPDRAILVHPIQFLLLAPNGGPNCLEFLVRLAKCAFF